MRLTEIRLSEFRNFRSEQATFSPQTNVLVGPNGQGKTNLLEAINFLGYGRSFRTSRARECIRHGERSAAIAGFVEHQGGERILGVEISNVARKLLVDGKAVSIPEFVGTLHVLAFTGAHLSVIRGGPAERRAFLDRGMATLIPGHVARLAAYTRSVKQRNRMLVDARTQGTRIEDALLESWEERIVEAGARILWSRRRYVENLAQRLPEGLFADERLKLRYDGAVTEEASSIDDIAEALRRRLAAARRTDVKNGWTSVGPHRDELEIHLEGKPLAHYGSAGQQRSSLVALYASQMETHRDHHGFYPVLLMDDAEAELDPARIDTMLRYLTGRTQVFLTTAKEAVLPRLEIPVRKYRIDSGHLEKGTDFRADSGESSPA